MNSLRSISIPCYTAAYRAGGFMETGVQAARGSAHRWASYPLGEACQADISHATMQTKVACAQFHGRAGEGPPDRGPSLISRSAGAFRVDGVNSALCDLLFVVEGNVVERLSLRVNACGGDRASFAIRGHSYDDNLDQLPGLRTVGDDGVSIYARNQRLTA